VIEGAEGVDPPADGVHRRARLVGERRVVELVPRPRGEDPDEKGKLVDLLDAREIPDVAAHELLGPRLVPPQGEAPVVVQVGLGEAAALEQTAPGRGLDPGRIAQKPVGRRRIEQLPDRKGMQPKGEVAAHQAVSVTTNLR
jgi:hypothetical protein